MRYTVYTVLQYSISHSFHSKGIREALIPLPDDDLPDNQKDYGIGILMEFC